jgi:hypothetical protein
MARELTHLLAQRGSRELATRESDGLHVQLLWDPVADAVTVVVEDLRAVALVRFCTDRRCGIARMLGRCGPRRLGRFLKADPA